MAVKRRGDTAMKRKILVIMLALSLLGIMSGSASAGVLGYNLDRAERGFVDPPGTEPSAAVVFMDSLVAKPAGTVVTAGGTALFVLTLPWTIPSKSTDQAARSLIGRPFGYSFVRPVGRSDKRFEEQGVFGK